MEVNAGQNRSCKFTMRESMVATHTSASKYVMPRYLPGKVGEAIMLSQLMRLEYQARVVLGGTGTAGTMMTVCKT